MERGVLLKQAVSIKLGIGVRHVIGTTNHANGCWQVAGADVKRILVTRLVGNTYYARILLTLPGGVERSVDARPSDSLALALQCSAPVFVSKQIAR